MIGCIEQESLKIRRSIYHLGNTAMVADHCVIDTVEECVKNCPTAFNSQSARVAVLFKKYHTAFWKMVWENVEAVTPKDKKESAKKRINSFAEAYGTVLFFEDINTLEKLKKDYPLYQQNMWDWAIESNAILQFMIWQSLAENNEGASLQHYNELIEGKVNMWLNLPKEWKIIAQMPWGNIEKEAGEKSFLPIENRVKIFK